MDLGPGTFRSACSSGNVVWFLRTDTNELRAFTISSSGRLVRNTGQDITGLPAGFVGCVTDGTDIWLINNSTNIAVSYSISSKTVSSKNIGLGSGSWDGGSVYNGSNLYFVNRNSVPHGTSSYLASNRSRQSSKDFNLFDPNRAAYRGAFGVGKESWFIDDFNNVAYCYYLDIDVGSASIPQPYQSTSYRVVSTNNTLSAHQDVTIDVTQNPVIVAGSFRRTGFHQAPRLLAGTFQFTARIKGYPQPTLNYRFGNNRQGTITARHLTPTNNVNEWTMSWTIYHTVLNDSLTLTASNTSTPPATATIQNIAT